MKIARETWSLVRFGEVAKLSKTRIADPVAEGIEHYVGIEHIEPEDLRIRSWGLVADGTTFTNQFEPGQVLFVKRRAYQRKVAVADFAGVCSGDIYVLESKGADVLLPELLPFICQSESFFEHAVGTSAGSLSPRTNWKQLANYEFALPPLAEQRRIAEVLLAAEQVRVRAQHVESKAWRTRIAMYKELTQTGVHRTGLKISPLGFTPTHWEVSRVADVVEIHNDLRKPISAEERQQQPGPYPYWGATGVLDSIDEFRLEGTYALIGEDGDHFLKQSIWSMTHLVSGRFNVNNHAHVIKGTEKCSTEWFFHYFRHRDIRRWLTKQGSGRLKLKKADLAQMLIAVPPPEEQAHLVDNLNTFVDGNISVSGHAVESAQLLKGLIQCSIGN